MKSNKFGKEKNTTIFFMKIFRCKVDSLCVRQIDKIRSTQSRQIARRRVRFLLIYHEL